MSGIDRLKAGDFNTMNQVAQPDGSVIITLEKRGEGKVYRFAVRNLYKVDEEVLWDEIKERG